MGLFDPDPYGGTAPWAEAAMLIGSGLMAGGAPGGGGLMALGRMGPELARMGSRRADRARLARAEERADESLALQREAFQARQEEGLQARQAKWRMGAAMGLPPELLGPMPGGPQSVGVPMPPEGPVRASESTGLMYDEPAVSQQTGLMPNPQDLGGLMGSGYFESLPANIKQAVAPLMMGGEYGQAVRLAESMQEERRPRQFEVEKQAMLDAGMSEDEYNTMVMNRERYRPYVDEFGNRRIMDLLAPTSPTTLPATDIGEAPVLDEPERVAGVPSIPEGYEEAFGGSGFFRNIGNEIAGFFGAENLPYEQTQRAQTAINTLNTRTKLEMAEGIPGRPSNLTREELGRLGVTPGSFFTGDEKARIRIEETVGMLDSQIDNFNQIANDPDAPADQRAAALRKVSTLREMRDGWDQVRGSFENPYSDYTREQLNEMNTSEMTQQQLEAAAERYDQLERTGR